MNTMFNVSSSCKYKERGKTYMLIKFNMTKLFRLKLKFLSIFSKHYYEIFEQDKYFIIYKTEK